MNPCLYVYQLNLSQINLTQFIVFCFCCKNLLNLLIAALLFIEILTVKTHSQILIHDINYKQINGETGFPNLESAGNISIFTVNISKMKNQF